MIDKDYEALARRIVGLEQRLEAFSRTRQLGNSSVTLADGSDASVSGGVGAGNDAQHAIESIDDSLNDVDEINDTEVEHSVSVPEWIEHASPDTTWDFASAVNENVDAALENADQAVSDALAAAQKAAEADKKATEARGAAKEYLPNTNFSLGADGLDGWTVLDGTASTYEGAGLLLGISFDEDDQTVWHDYVEDASIRGNGEYSIPPGSSIELSTDFTVLSGGDSYLTMYIDVAVAGSHYVRTKEITISETNISATRSMTWTNDDDEAAYVRVGYVIHVEPGVQYVNVNQATLKDVTEVIKAQKEAESARFLAEGIFNVIPSVAEPTQAPNGSALKQGDQWWVIGEQGSEQAGKFVGVKVFDGTQWIDRQIVADSVLVPGSVGPILLEDGAVSAPKLAADAIDGMTITGALIRTASWGSRLELDHEGLKAFDASNNETVRVRSESGLLSIKKIGSIYETQLSERGINISSATESGGIITHRTLASIDEKSLDLYGDWVEATVDPATTMARLQPHKLNLSVSRKDGTPATRAYGDLTMRVRPPYSEYGPNKGAAFIEAENVTQLGIMAPLIYLNGKTVFPGNTFYLRADLNNWTDVPDGTRAWVTAENREYVRVGGTWRPLPTPAAQPYAMAAGSATVTPVANTPTSTTVTFPIGRFSAAPMVTATASSAVVGTTVRGVGVASITATSVAIYVTRTNTTNTSVRWIAVQMTE